MIVVQALLLAVPALLVTLANERVREHLEALAAGVQGTIGELVELAYMDQGYMGRDVVKAAAGWGIRLEVLGRDRGS